MKSLVSRTQLQFILQKRVARWEKANQSQWEAQALLRLRERLFETVSAVAEIWE